MLKANEKTMKDDISQQREASEKDINTNVGLKDVGGSQEYRASDENKKPHL
jgi:hypothetical protein